MEATTLSQEQQQTPPPPFVRIDASIKDGGIASNVGALTSATKITLDKVAEIERDAANALEVSQLVRVLNGTLFQDELRVHGKRIVGLSLDDGTKLHPETKLIELNGKRLVALMEDHIHEEDLQLDIYLAKTRDVLSRDLTHCLEFEFQRICNHPNREMRFRRLLDSIDLVAENSSLERLGRLLSCYSTALLIYDGKETDKDEPRNEPFENALRLLESDRYNDAIRAFAKERNKHIGLRNLSEAAHYYERGSQIVIRKLVFTSPIHNLTFNTTTTPPTDSNYWIKVETPIRLDFAGGWTDTPPLTYERGGVVVNIAAKLDGKRPVGCKARRLREPVLRFHIDNHQEPLTCKHIADLLDYSKPLAPGALIKACILSIGVISIKSSDSLEEQLVRRGGGLELMTWSHVPTGSGLGTSSIMAGAIVKAITEAFGCECDLQSLLHAVLHVEQMLSTGGGWQDQVGGLIGGIKISRSKASIPLLVDYHTIENIEATLDKLNKHLILIYTGVSRLAKNLLQTVIRRWFSRKPKIMELTHEMTRNTEDMREAIEQGDLELIAKYLNLYWAQKKKMAKGAEPSYVSQLMNVLYKNNLIYGCSLMGAGGGGFMVAITKKENDMDSIQAALQREYPEYAKLSFHHATIDTVGMTITKEQCTDE